MAQELITWPHEDALSLNRFYGDPRGEHGLVSPEWHAENIVWWAPPYPMFYSDGVHTPLHHLQVHKRCLGAFEAAFVAVLQELGHDYIVEKRLNISGGTFCYRVERGGSRLSVHAWGCAIDMDPQHNPFPHRWMANRGMVDLKFAEIMERHGFHWRGVNGDDDPMHFQCAQH